MWAILYEFFIVRDDDSDDIMADDSQVNSLSSFDRKFEILFAKSYFQVRKKDFFIYILCYVGHIV